MVHNGMEYGNILNFRLFLLFIFVTLFIANPAYAEPLLDLQNSVEPPIININNCTELQNKTTVSVDVSGFGEENLNKEFDVVFGLDFRDGVDWSEPSDPVKEALISFVDSLDYDNNQAGFVFWNDTVGFKLDFTSDFDTAKDLFEELGGVGYSNVTAGFESCAEIHDLTGRVGTDSYIIYITDGNSPEYEDDEIDEFVSNALNKDYVIYTVSIGIIDNSDEELLNKIADETGGSSFYPVDRDELSETIQTIMRDIRTESASNLVLNLEFENYVLVNPDSFSIAPDTVSSNEDGETTIVWDDLLKSAGDNADLNPDETISLTFDIQCSISGEDLPVIIPENSYVTFEIGSENFRQDIPQIYIDVIGELLEETDEETELSKISPGSTSSGVEIVTGGGEVPVILAKWEQDTNVYLEDGDELHSEPGSQFLPPLEFEGTKEIEYYAIVFDEEDAGNVSVVAADVYHPDNELLANTEYELKKYQINLKNIGNDDEAKELVMDADAAGLINFKDGYSLKGLNDDSQDPESSVLYYLNKGTADVWKGTAVIHYCQPAGEYLVSVRALDRNSNPSLPLNNIFYYRPVGGVEFDFVSVDYGNATVLENKWATGNTIFETGDGLPTVRNIGNIPVRIKIVRQDSMGFGITNNGEWDVKFDMRLGNSGEVETYYPSYVNGPDVNVVLEDKLWMCHSEELDFSIHILKGFSGEYHSGEIILSYEDAWTDETNEDL
ncbi:VWA domain-containing protein [Methanoplanus sp. FWC-SCC4]|uniref:VWA domain-containing protein n=1 Tax=Methanochimaera problematica TaxID=2609417 RepID=A0AA97I266_9EURY|nr:vWA domain-containing protein [Methanoplanus sp. FWC-SCC4]WOF15930.1 VWA domain-containing protein [Methanoplanus sp. FWC-SCC4]